MRPLVSILIPAYNAEAWLSDTLRSAIAQTWEPKEIIVVDDGSTDRTLAVAQQFESNQLRVVTHKNQGAAAARNKAYSLCHGDYIQYLDADDLLAPDKIARQMQIIAEVGKSCLLSSAWGRFLHRRSRAKFIRTALWNDLSPREWLVRKMGQSLYMSDATWLVSRELTEAAGPWDSRLVVDDDGEYFSRVLLLSEGVRFVPEARVYYRSSGPHSVSQIGRSSLKLEAQWRSMQLHIQYLRSMEDSPAVRSTCLQFLQNCLIYFYPERPDILQQMQQTADELGGTLSSPQLSWKYSWLQQMFGWAIAKRVQYCARRVRWSVASHWDQVAFGIERFVASSGGQEL